MSNIIDEHPVRCWYVTWTAAEDLNEHFHQSTQNCAVLLTKDLKKPRQHTNKTQSS